MSTINPEIFEVRWLPGERQRTIDDWPEFDPDSLAHYHCAPPEAIQVMLDPNLSTTDGEGRSPWMWIRLPNGDLIFGCFPQGDTYFEHEGSRHV